MKHCLRILLTLCLLLGTPASLSLAASWELIELARVDTSVEERIDVEVRDTYIYLTTNKPVTVKICTILGQLVSQEKISAGVSRIKLGQRGVYILKAGTVTRRVNI